MRGSELAEKCPALAPVHQAGQWGRLPQAISVVRRIERGCECGRKPRVEDGRPLVQGRQGSWSCGLPPAGNQRFRVFEALWVGAQVRTHAFVEHETASIEQAVVHDASIAKRPGHGNLAPQPEDARARSLPQEAYPPGRCPTVDGPEKTDSA